MTDTTDILVQLQLKASNNRLKQKSIAATGYAEEKTPFGKIVCRIRVKGNYTGVGSPWYPAVGFELNGNRISRSKLVAIIEKAGNQ